MPDEPTPTTPEAPAPRVNSFIQNTVSLDLAVANDLGKRTFVDVQQGLAAFDAFVQKMEKLAANGGDVKMQGDVYNMSFEDFRRVMGDSAANEIEQLAKRGRALLQFFGFQKKNVATRNTMLVTGAKETSKAVAMVQERVRPGTFPGDVPLTDVDVIPLSPPPAAPSIQ